MTHRAPLPRSLLLAALAAAVAVGGLAGPATAVPVETSGGTVGLPVTGLSVDLPAAPPGCNYRLSGSWLIDGDGGFDGRDVIDEACGDSLVAGNWISLGYFTAGDDAAVVAAASLTDDWTSEVDLWGAHWFLRGGTLDLGELGPTSAVVLSTPLGGGMSLLMYHFFLQDPPPMPSAAMLEGVERCLVLQAAWSACAQKRFAPVRTTQHAEIRNRGETAASRSVLLGNMGLEVAIPDDGYVWIVRQDSTAVTDYLDRMAPSLPDVSLEAAYVAGADGPTVFASLTADKRDVAPRNLPDGWQPGPQLVLGDKFELTASYETVDGVIIVGIFQGTEDTDVAYLAPMFEAVAQAAAAAQAYPEDE